LGGGGFYILYLHIFSNHDRIGFQKIRELWPPTPLDAPKNHYFRYNKTAENVGNNAHQSTKRKNTKLIPNYSKIVLKAELKVTLLSTIRTSLLKTFLYSNPFIKSIQH